jgi:hypothetical protein
VTRLKLVLKHGDRHLSPLLVREEGGAAGSGTKIVGEVVGRRVEAEKFEALHRIA